MIKVVYIATDLIKTDEGYCFNAVYAFKSMTSVRNYEKYLRSSGKDHLLSVTSAAVDIDLSTINVVTELKVADGDVQYIASHVFEHYDDARDYVANIDCAQSEMKTEHNAVKISSRFSPEILHDGWAEF